VLVPAMEGRRTVGVWHRRENTVGNDRIFARAAAIHLQCRQCRRHVGHDNTCGVHEERRSNPDSASTSANLDNTCTPAAQQLPEANPQIR